MPQARNPLAAGQVNRAGAQAMSHFVQGSSGVMLDYALGSPGSETFRYMLMVEGALPLTLTELADTLII